MTHHVDGDVGSPWWHVAFVDHAKLSVVISFSVIVGYSYGNNEAGD